MSAASTRRTTTRRWTRAIGSAAVLALAATAVVVVAVLAAVLVTGEPWGEGAWTLAPVVTAAVIGIVAWPPARRAARTVAARTARRSGRTPDDVMRSVGTALAEGRQVDEILADLTDSFRRAFGAASVEIWRDDDDGGFARGAALPSAPAATILLDEAAVRILGGGGVVGRAWADLWAPELTAGSPGELRIAPAAHAGELLGLVVLRRDEGAERFTASQDAALAELGSRLGLVFHNWELDTALRGTLEDLRRSNADLRASRERLVATADAERRKFERNLHDGAQQHLVALAVNLKMAAAEITADPATAPQLFAALADDVREAINEVRALAHGIYPPLLMDAGVVEALRVSARRSPSPVTVTAERVGRYPTELEAAAYFCCMEALQNAAKHAPGAQVRVHVADERNALRLVVEDDGPGIDVERLDAGQGIGNMTDRVGAVGGELIVDRSPSGGTRVTAVIPLREHVHPARGA